MVEMRVTEVITVNIDRVPLTDLGKQVYRTLVSSGIRTPAELMRIMDISEGMAYLMLAHLYRHDIIKMRV